LNNKKKLKIIILYALAGGGHFSQSKSIGSLIKKAYPDAEIELINGFEKSPKVFQRGFTEGYQKLTGKYLFLWKLFYFSFQYKAFFALYKLIITKFSKKFILQKIDDFKPDIVIDTYYFSTFIKTGKTRCIKVVTDPFTPANCNFFNSDLDQYFVYSKQAFKIGSKFVNPEKIKIIKPVLNYDFLDETYQSNFFGKKILILSGGDGFAGIKKLLKQLSKKTDYHLKIVCGRDLNLKKFTQKLKSEADLKWEIYGFSNEIKNLIDASDLVITKAGPSSIFEIIARKKPLIIYSYIWKQELGNLNFVLQNKLGWYINNPSKVIQKIDTLSQNQDLYQQTNQKLQNYDLHYSAKETVEKILEKL
jgi:processive 1,2-diacylglycerol beta-glucosyltransferase/1,2-diacylglycerol 3-beta-galactosyltransferase